MIESLLHKEETSLTFTGKEVDLARSLFDSLTSGEVFNSTLLEVDKMQQNFNLGRHTTLYATGLKLFTRSSRNIKEPRYIKKTMFVLD